MMKFVLSNTTTGKQAHHAMPHLHESCLNATFYCSGNSRKVKKPTWKGFRVAHMLWS